MEVAAGNNRRLPVNTLKSPLNFELFSITLLFPIWRRARQPLPTLPRHGQSDPLPLQE